MTIAPQKLAHQRPIRLYDEDDKALRKLHDSISDDYQIDIVQLIREAVHAGLPVVLKRFKADK